MATTKKVTPKTISKKQTPGYSANNTSTLNQVKLKKGGEAKDKNWIQKAVKGMRKDRPCTGSKFGSSACPPGSKRYNLAKTFKSINKK